MSQRVVVVVCVVSVAFVRLSLVSGKLRKSGKLWGKSFVTFLFFFLRIKTTRTYTFTRTEREREKRSEKFVSRYITRESVRV